MKPRRKRNPTPTPRRRPLLADGHTKRGGWSGDTDAEDVKPPTKHPAYPARQTRDDT